MSYGKIFCSIFDSTLVSDGGWLPTYILMSMVALADKDGIVDIAPKALFRRLGFREYDSKITFDDFMVAIHYLEAEDPESRSSVESGRRIIPISEIDEIDGNRGWYIVNYEYYRRKASKSEPPGSSTQRVQKFRARKNEEQKNNDLEKCNGNVTEGNGSNGIGNGHTDTDTDTDTDITYTKSASVPCKQIVDLYNTICTKLPQVLKVTSARETAIRARWASDPEYQTLDFWEKYFHKVNKTPFLTGGSKDGWRANFDFCVRESGFVNILEGKYSSTQMAQPGPKEFPDE
ncbi:MAG: hypothetical protein OEX19_15320 [Gammaproteobacteria bacterium]|nr:hypothetical protein [Gammaproteobacteria bacterium]